MKRIISVIIPTYNRLQHICRAIESVMAQTFAASEIIIIDDGSNDGTGEVVHEKYGSNVIVIRQANKGVAAARNRGVEAATGSWIAFLDSDDVWLPTKLEKQCVALATFGDDFGVCFTNCSYIGNCNTGVTVFEEAGLAVHDEYGAVASPLPYVTDEYGIYVQSLLIRRSLFAKTGEFDEALHLSEDRDFVFRLSLVTRFCYVSEPLVHIDRSPSVERLTRALFRRSDAEYGYLEAVYRKALSNSMLTDCNSRQKILDTLEQYYYGWASERISQFRLFSAGRIIQKVYRLNHCYTKIAKVLFLRAWNKLTKGSSCNGGNNRLAFY